MSKDAQRIGRRDQQFNRTNALAVMADDLQVQVAESWFMAAEDGAASDQATFILEGHRVPPEEATSKMTHFLLKEHYADALRQPIAK